MDLSTGKGFKLDNLGGIWYIPIPKYRTDKHYAIGVSPLKLTSSELTQIEKILSLDSSGYVDTHQLENLPITLLKNIEFYYHGFES